MLTAMWVAAAVAGLVHVLFFCMESLWWTKPAVYRRFRSTEAEALVTRSLAFNQGLWVMFDECYRGLVREPINSSPT